MAHPDDAEILCAGTLARLHEKGYLIHITSMTSGDCGSVELAPDVIGRIREKEARKSAKVLNASYGCFGLRDLFVVYDAPSIGQAAEMIRKYDPLMVFTHSPRDYMVDHEITSMIVRNACFGAGMPNFRTDCQETHPPSSGVPYLYYADPIEGKDIFGEEIKPGFYINITKTMSTKERMLKCHASQREWLRKHHGIDQYVVSMKVWSMRRGNESGVKYAEAFRQHLGHAYPQDNKLAEILEK
jgi:LmbE family N-acetylglucosaminyl deacetylase